MDLSIKFKKVQQAGRALNEFGEKEINRVLNGIANSIIKNKSKVIKANAKDLKKMNSGDPKYDRLLLNEERLKGIAKDIETVASLPCPVGESLEQKRLKNGLKVKRIRVPFGVIGIIYEARPNVTLDSFALCLKSKNACILKGGSDAKYSNEIFIKIIKRELKKNGLPEDLVFLMPSDRKYLIQLLEARKYVEVIIPRGSQNLINYVVENSLVPVIETGAGVVHTFFDASGDSDMGAKIILNAKTRRPSVCNALDTLIIHKKRLKDLHKLVAPLINHKVILYCDLPSFKALKSKYPDELLFNASNEHFGTEFLSLKMSIKTVKDVGEAVSHITKYSTRHSEAIIADNKNTVRYFLNSVDAAVVYANTSTAFTDGAQFGLGAEIGISTQKLHARGPMALREMTSYKWIVEGEGQVRKA